jgi:CheY-like chemotaxis protein
MATILLIEDDPATREALTASLQADGHTVLGAGTGLEALTVAAVDLRLPDAYGFDLAQRLRQELRTPSIPILAVSGYAVDHLAEDLAASGCVGFLAKPISRELLREALRHYLPGA